MTTGKPTADIPANIRVNDPRGVQIISHGVPVYWPFLAGAGIGFILAMFLFAHASNLIDQNRINAGVFERNGIAYRITPEAL